jgi:hypothetical protein
MKPFAKITLVLGVEHHRATDEREITPLNAYTREEDAVAFGVLWAREQGELHTEQGRNVSCSYKLQTINLY